MTQLRPFWMLSVLALALAFGQQAVLLHDLSHGFGRIHADSHGQHPASNTCEKCFAFAELCVAIPAFAGALLVATSPLPAALFSSNPAQSRTVASSRSRELG